MRVSILIALLPCALLAQTSPPRPANQDVLKNLQQRLDWFQPGVHSPQSGWEWHVYWSPSVELPGAGVAVATIPGTCSIPLLRAPIPKGFTDRMPLPRLPGDTIDPKMLLPTPSVCGERKP
ncbi:MAG: hypothetical protein WBL61_01470 [Bryobacteraceae bacterium]